MAADESTGNIELEDTQKKNTEEEVQTSGTNGTPTEGTCVFGSNGTPTQDTCV